MIEIYCNGEKMKKIEGIKAVDIRANNCKVTSVIVTINDDRKYLFVSQGEII